MKLFELKRSFLYLKRFFCKVRVGSWYVTRWQIRVCHPWWSVRSPIEWWFRIISDFTVSVLSEKTLLLTNKCSYNHIYLFAAGRVIAVGLIARRSHWRQLWWMSGRLELFSSSLFPVRQTIRFDVGVVVWLPDAERTRHTHHTGHFFRGFICITSSLHQVTTHYATCGTTFCILTRTTQGCSGIV